MRKLLISFLILVFLAGCSSKPFEPVIRQLREIIDLNEEVDPLTLIEDVENKGYKIEIESSDLDSATPGQYTITYKISSGRKSCTKEFTFLVKDYDAPVIECSDTIEVLYGNPFVLTDYAKASDEIDGDLTDSIHYTGSINTFSIGSYSLKLSVSDKFGNTAEKTVTVKVVKDSSESYKASICGTYKDINYTDGQQPTITINADGTFSMYLNSCSVVNLIEGDYVQYENTLYLMTSDYEFSYTAESNLARMIIQLDGQLMFDTQTSLCAPCYGDMFAKVEETTETAE